MILLLESHLCFHLEFLYFPGSIRQPFLLLSLFYYILQVFFQLQFFLDLLVLFFFSVVVTCSVGEGFSSTSLFSILFNNFKVLIQVLTQVIKSKNFVFVVFFKI